MEEKERFELFGEHCIKDNSPDARPQLLDAYVACVILNEQDKRIKELEEENLSLQEQSIRDNQNWIEETTKLKQQLAEKEKEIEELEEENKELNDYLETDKVTKREYYQKVDKNDKAKDREIKKLKDKIKELEDYTENTAELIDKLTEDSVFASTQLAIEELKKLKENAWQSATDISQLIDYTELAKIIDNQIKELKGEE